MVEAEVKFEPDKQTFDVDSYNFGLIDKKGHTYQLVTHNPRLVSDSAQINGLYWDFDFWRGQLFFAVPKNTQISDYTLTFSDKVNTTVPIDLAKLTK
jgi:hypothetical protein